MNSNKSRYRMIGAPRTSFKENKKIKLNYVVKVESMV